jgi:hypothetical protein
MVAVGGIGEGVNVLVGTGVFEANIAPIFREAPVNQVTTNAAPRIINSTAPTKRAMVCQD